MEFLSKVLESFPLSHSIIEKHHKDIGTFFILGYTINVIFKKVSDLYLKEKKSLSENDAFYELFKALRVCASGYLSYQLMIRVFKSAITSVEVARALPFMCGSLMIFKYAP